MCVWSACTPPRNKSVEKAIATVYAIAHMPRSPLSSCSRETTRSPNDVANGGRCGSATGNTNSPLGPAGVCVVRGGLGLRVEGIGLRVGGLCCTGKPRGQFAYTDTELHHPVICDAACYECCHLFVCNRATSHQRSPRAHRACTGKRLHGNIYSRTPDPSDVSTLRARANLISSAPPQVTSRSDGAPP